MNCPACGQAVGRCDHLPSERPAALPHDTGQRIVSTGYDPNPDNWDSPTRPNPPDWRTQPEAYDRWCYLYGHL